MPIHVHALSFFAVETEGLVAPSSTAHIRASTASHPSTALGCRATPDNLMREGKQKQCGKLICISVASLEESLFSFAHIE
jgi:hypothetical protein